MADNDIIEARITVLEQANAIDQEQRVSRQMKLDGEIDGLMAEVQGISKRLFGNGSVEGSICWRVSECEGAIRLVNDRLNVMLKTDNWRRDVLIKAISAVVTAVLVAALLQQMGFKR